MQYSLFIDGVAQRASTLMVCEADGAMRLANRAEILSAGRELVSVDEIRSQALTIPATVKDLLRLRLTGVEHEVCGVLPLDSRN